MGGRFVSFACVGLRDLTRTSCFHIENLETCGGGRNSAKDAKLQLMVCYPTSLDKVGRLSVEQESGWRDFLAWALELGVP